MERNDENLPKSKIWRFYFLKTLIFVTVGTHPEQFNRLIKEINKINNKNWIFFIQKGTSNLKTKAKSIAFLELDEFQKKIKKADLIITHGGEGIIGTCIQLNKKMIIVPRLKKFGEHTNNHQLDLSNAINKKFKTPIIINIKNLEKEIKKILKKETKYKKEKGNIIKLINDFIKKNNL